jgi:hypothetical protein
MVKFYDEEYKSLYKKEYKIVSNNKTIIINGGHICGNDDTIWLTKPIQKFAGDSIYLLSKTLDYCQFEMVFRYGNDIYLCDRRVTRLFTKVNGYYIHLDTDSIVSRNRLILRDVV